MQHPKLVHPRLTIHPLTGAAIAPVGYRKNGRPIWPILGGAPDDGGDDGKGGGKNEPAGGDDGKGGKPSDGDDGNGGKNEPSGGDDGKGGKPSDDGGAGGKDALKADLARERDKRQELERSIADMKDGFAKALGLKPEETSDTEKLATSLTDLKERLDKSDRQTQLLTIATEFKLDKDDLHMLTASDESGLRKQAEWIQSKTTKEPETGPRGRRPKPDGSQGGGTGSDSGPKSVADVMAERRAARESKTKTTT